MPDPTDLDKFVCWTGTLPAGWVQLPLDPAVDADEWSRSHQEQAAAGLVEEPGELGAELAGAMLARLTRSVRASLDPDLAAPLAVALHPNVLDRVLAVVTAAAYPDSSESVRSTTGDDAVSDLDASRIQLPIGPTARVRRVVQASSDLDPGATWLSADLAERLTYISEPPGLPGFTVIEAVWGDLVLGDPIAEMVDDLASSLSIEFVQ